LVLESPRIILTHIGDMCGKTGSWSEETRRGKGDLGR
jgi:hypothetical protein